MVLKPDQQRVCTMLKDTITLLCKNGLAFKKKFTIEAVIGVTLDDEFMFHVSLSEIIRSATDENDTDTSGSPTVEQHQRKRRKRPRIKRESKNSGESGGSAVSSDEGGAESDAPSQNGDSSLGPAAKQQDIKGEPASLSATDDQDDIMFVKQEMDDSCWSETTSQNYTSVTDTQSHDPNLSLSDMTLVPVGHSQDGNSTGAMWPTPTDGMLGQQLHQYRPRLHRTATVTGAGGMQQQGGSQQQQTGIDQQQQSSIAVGSDLVCPICCKRCTSRGNLKKHISWHSGLFQYYCPYCPNKGFMSTSDLRGHISWHTGIKEFKCTECSKEFRYKRQLTDHIRAHHAGTRIQ